MIWGLAAAAPEPLRATVEVLPVVESLPMTSWPLTAPVAVGLNCTVKDIDWPALKVAGKLPEMMLKPAPLIEAEFTVRSDVPVDVRVTVFVVAVFTVTLP